ncbi:YihY/virulence factor BrkB family protein [Sandaracinobacter sp. RS1-74]|uniref:YihY/virulence factor BrkB family protein n=1 Tax=Sandaracinobacteroides sayramensis TaxID=2913411 RepID=UPI001EDAB720|nr:YihY/virulence factor BrkB family protein [Sandaracinobacteroides sayramensis]MCG2839690.1 YihY/virulence factor BrkB family protein [Sandaracinobacteroides sayramensis]
MNVRETAAAWWAGVASRKPRTIAAARRVVSRTLRDGYIHAGNIAYLSLVTLLPLIILITAVTVAFGQTDAGQYAIHALLRALPANIADLFAPVIEEVLQARTGNLLWIGGLVALWTVTTFIETLRDISFRAFGVNPERHFLAYRLQSLAGTLIAIFLALVAFLLQVVMVVAVRAVEGLVPLGIELPGWIDWSRLVTPVGLFLVLWALLKLLTPPGFKYSPSWPGALITTFAWVIGSLLLGPTFSSFSHMGLTYGALSGVMLAMLFFYAIGFALVAGVEVNAALAEAYS